MLQTPALRKDIDTALAAPTTADSVLGAKRHMGLRFLVRARRGQSRSEVAAAFKALDDRFEVEPLFPAPLLAVEDPADEAAFVAAIHGVSFDDVSASPWDIAHAAREKGGLVRVTPDAPPTPGATAPQAEAVAAEDLPGPGWEPMTMKIPEAWKAITDSGRGRGLGQGIRIGHLDTGWSHHPVWGSGEPNLDLGSQRNFIERGQEALDPLTGFFPFASPGHGTATASVMVAPRGNPVVGVAPDAKVVPIRCIRSVILIGQPEIAEAIRHARDVGCQIISMSFGGAVTQELRKEIEKAVNGNIIVVAAAGQLEPPAPGVPTVYPAAFPECIAVSGVEGVNGVSDPREGYKAWNTANRSDPNGEFGRITISAPAYKVYRAEANPERAPKYGNSYGTSFSTAFMAGIAALWLSHHFPKGYQGTITAQECFRRHVQKHARRYGTFDPWFFGMVDAGKLITTEPEPNPKDGAPAPDIDDSMASTVAGLLGCTSADEGRRLLAQTLIGRQTLPEMEAADSQEAWIAEIGDILHRNPDLRARAATAPALRDLLMPHASQALRERLAVPERA